MNNFIILALFVLTYASIRAAEGRCTATVQQGSRGACVREVQRAVGTTEDGIFGPNTKRAVIAFQRFRGLVADGIVGPKTWAAIYDVLEDMHCYATVRQGSTGPCVRVVQETVGTTVDGIFGPNTKAAVIAFQKSRGLVADGIVGPKTWDAIWRARS